MAEPETGPLLCRTALWDCFKDTNTASFIGSVSFANFEFILFALCSPTSTLPFNLKCGLKTSFF